MPLDTVKTQMQLKPYASPLACGRAIVAADGAVGLYYGFRPFLLQASGKAAVRFFMYENICAAVDACGVDRTASPTRWSMVCGMGAGMCEALFWTAPTERLKVLRQATAGTGAGGGTTTVLTVVREQGLGGLYVGALPTAARQASSTAVSVCTARIRARHRYVSGKYRRHRRRRHRPWPWRDPSTAADSHAAVPRPLPVDLDAWPRITARESGALRDPLAHQDHGVRRFRLR